MAVGSIALAAVVGVPIGLVAGYTGGRVDLVVMRAVELILVLPALLLAISLIAVLGTGTPITVIAIAVIFFPILARVMRSAAQVVTTLPFVDASRARGRVARASRSATCCPTPSVRCWCRARC